MGEKSDAGGLKPGEVITKFGKDSLKEGGEVLQKGVYSAEGAWCQGRQHFRASGGALYLGDLPTRENEKSHSEEEKESLRLWEKVVDT